ncbi:unnamed protein product [Xylocopa violacea]|uniref:Odorant receptor n=1 Tax=Xylocopa violacea TaxID=135666 RepID=A0ABP1NWM6_XYLVO
MKWESQLKVGKITSRSRTTMNDVIKVRDVLLLNERVFSICDAWPLKKSYMNFVIYASYLTVHMVIMYMDLFDALGNLKAMVDNIIDSTVATATYLLLFLLRFSKLIKQAIIVVKQEIAESKFEDVEEMRLYLAYHNISYKFSRYAAPTTTTLVVLLYLLPMLQLAMSDLGKGNGTSNAYVLPFRVHAFFDYQEDFRVFIFMYLYQFPLVFIALCHISAVSLVLSMVLHVCGKFSILSYRIKNITAISQVNLDSKIKELVIAHIKIMMTANSINSALQIFLLIDLIQTTIRMAIVTYMMLVNPDENFVSRFTYSLYMTLITSILFLYCFMGERLSHESSKVWEAYFDTDWHNLSIHDQKSMLLVMSSGRQIMHVTAGKLYTFSLIGFIGVVKTAFGYVSLLRALT